MTSAAARPKLPVWPTVRDAFATIPAHWLSVVRIFWAWTVVWGILITLWFLTFPLRAFLRLEVPPSSEFVTPGPAFFLTLVALAVALFVVGFLALASTAVAWHRLILLGEVPPVLYLGLGGPVLRYLGRLLLIGLSALPILLLCVVLLWPLVHHLAPMPTSFSPPSFRQIVTHSVLTLVVPLPAAVVLAQLSISLPAVAIGRPMTLSEAWESTAGTTLRLLGGAVLIYLPSYAFGLAIQRAAWSLRWLPGDSLVITATLFFLANVLVGFVVAVAAIGFLSLSYRVLVGTGEPVQPAAA